MVQLFVLLVSLLLIGLLAHLAQRARRPAPPMPQVEPLPAPRLMAHLRVIAASLPGVRLRALPAGLPIRPLNRLLRRKTALPALAFLRDNGRELLLLLMTLRQRLRTSPRLPGPPMGEPRLLALGQRYWQLGGGATADDLLAALTEVQPIAGLTLQERLHLPLCLSLALCRQLASVLENIRMSQAEYRHGLRLARKLRHARRPMHRLSNRPLTPVETQALLSQLTAWQEHTLVASIQEKLTEEHTSAQQAAERFTARQTRLADHLRRILSGLRTLDRLDWSALLEPEDPLHRLLLADPTGTYPAMDAPSRDLYRRRAARLARLFHVEEQHLVQSALTLCRQADPDGLRDHVGWYLLEWAGVRALQARLRTRRGLLRLLLRRAEPWLYRTGLGLAALAGGLCFLHARHPLWALPVFLGVWSCLTHALVNGLRRRHSQAALPRMHITRVKENARVLLVLPAVLQDASQAVPAVRQLLLARKAFPQGAVDCLLLADYADCLTQTSSGDEATVSAARMAIGAVDGEDGCFLYLQRRRSWDAGQRVYLGRQRRQGALESLNRLIVTGECPDAFDAATLPPTAFHRRYAYVLALGLHDLPGPDSLLPLLGALTHPLNERRHTAEGVRGYSMLLSAAGVDAFAVETRLGCLATPENTSCLYRPDALLEATEGWLSPGSALGHAWLEGALSGCARDADVPFFSPPPATLASWLTLGHRRIRGDWQLVPWLFSHVQTPGGLRRNPLPSASRYALRQRLRRSLVPLCRLLMLLYAVLARSLPLVLLALPYAPPQRFLAGLVELPLQAAIQADAACRGLWRCFITRKRLLDWPAAFAATGLTPWENWCQCLASICLGAAALGLQPVFLPGLALALAFGCFPLVHPWLDAPLPTPAPTRDMEASLLEIAKATWRFFEETVTGVTHHLPPESLQLKPHRGAAGHTTPEAAGLYLLACLAMRELGLTDTEALCARASRTMDSLERLPLWHGLAYAAYDTGTLTPVAPAFIPSQENGLLCACLTALAQGLRSLLPETPDRHTGLSARVDAFASRMELFRLYDGKAQLFSTGYDVAQDALSARHHSLYASPARLLSFVAVMRREVPQHHLSRLNRTRVRLGFFAPYVSRHGTASEYFLPMLLLPAGRRTRLQHSLQAILHAQRKHGVEGMFGLSESGCWAFDPQLNYQRRAFGLAEAALEKCCTQAVIAPYAAALCLPFAPGAACDSLMRLRSRGMLTRLGYYDSLDMAAAHLPEGTREAPVQCHVTSHQAMLLCALCNLLTENALVAHFTAVPAAAAAVPLLQDNRPGLTLPARLIHPEHLAPREAPFRRSASPLSAPMEAHVAGSPEAMLVMSAQGLGAMRSRGVPLTCFTGDPTQVEGPQFYLADGTSTYRLTDPALPGDTLFGEGEMRFIRTCGQVQTTLIAFADPVQGAFLHVIEAVNLSGMERQIDLASCLIPDLGAPDSLAIARPEERVLTATCSHTVPGLTLCHAITTHEPLLSLTAETDRMAFQGRNRTLRHPAIPGTPQPQGQADAPCLAFRARLRLGAKGRAAVIFVTRLMVPGEGFSLEALAPRLSDTESLLALSRLMSRTMTDALLLSQRRAAELSRLFGPLLWQNQPRQGAIGPLDFPSEGLHALGLDPALPLLTVMVHSAACGPLVQDASDTIAWLALMGQPAGLCVLCQGGQAAQAQDRAQAILQDRPGPVLRCAGLPQGARETIEAASRFILYEGAGTVAEQLDAQRQVSPAIAHKPDPRAPGLPPERLDFPTAWGGYQPDTGDLVLRMEQGAFPPKPVSLLLVEGQAACRCLDSGLGAFLLGGDITLPGGDPVCPTMAECAYLSGDMGVFTPTPLPLGQGLSTRAQFTPGVCCWHSFGYGLDMTLTTAIIPETTLACRCLRLKNTTHKQQRLSLTIAARFTMGNEAFTCLTALDGCIIAASPAMKAQGCLALAEGEGRARAASPMAFHGFGDVPDLSAPADEAGTVALLTLPVDLPAGGGQAVSWVLGACASVDELELLLARLREAGTSAVFRQARCVWADRLSRLTLRTPDKRLDLLMNRLLPWQMHSARPGRPGVQPAALLACAGLVHTQPEQAREQLLACAGPALKNTNAGLLLPVMTCLYIHRTGDRAVLDAPAMGQASLYDCCLQALTSLALGPHGLPALPRGEGVAPGLLYMLALRLFAPYARGSAAMELEARRARAAEAIDRYGWDGRWYAPCLFAQGAPPDALCQCLAVLALGCTQRTAEAMEHALQQPVSPEDAPWLLWALGQLGWAGQTWAAVEALPDSLAPHQAAGVYAAVLERLLGLDRRGMQVRLQPMAPPGWDSFTLTLQYGASTWHFHAGQDEPLLTCDGERVTTGFVTLVDDGRIHEVRTPLRRGV